MSYQFAVSPDFSPNFLPGWYVFNTWLQKQINQKFHLEIYQSFQAQREALSRQEIDLMYASAFDAAVLVREKGFLPIVKAEGFSDEAVIVASAENPIDDIDGLGLGAKVAITANPDVYRMGMMMLESADLEANTVHFVHCDTYVTVAKQLLRAQADVGFFLAEAYDAFSDNIQSKLKVLVRSQIGLIHHCLIVGFNLSNQRAELQKRLLAMAQNEKGRGVLKSLGFSSWVSVEDEDMAFMIDLMNALTTDDLLASVLQG